MQQGGRLRRRRRASPTRHLRRTAVPVQTSRRFVSRRSTEGVRPGGCASIVGTCRRRPTTARPASRLEDEAADPPAAEARESSDCHRRAHCSRVRPERVVGDEGRCGLVDRWRRFMPAVPIHTRIRRRSHAQPAGWRAASSARAVTPIRSLSIYWCITASRTTQVVARSPRSSTPRSSATRACWARSSTRPAMPHLARPCASVGARRARARGRREQ